MLTKVTDVDSGDILANGDQVLDGYYDDKGEYALLIERIMPDGSADTYTVSYPLSSFMRLKDFYC